MRTRLKSLIEAGEVVEMIPVKSIVASGTPVREDLGDVDSLASSIRQSGLLEPILVRPRDTKFEIVAGHRRLMACRKNRFHEVPAIIKDLSDEEAYIVALEENLQRKTLDPIEEAASFKRYVGKFGYGSVSELARRIGKSEEYVSHRILLLSLPPPVLEQVRRRLLTSSDAWEIARVKEPGLQEAIANAAISNGSSVKKIREVANLAKAGSTVEEAFGWAGSGLRPEKEDLDRQRAAKLKSAALTTLRVAMLRLDGLLDATGGAQDDTRQELVGLRIAIHDLVGKFQGDAGASCSPFKEVASLVKDRFLTYFNSGRMKEISKMRSDDRFTIFDDYPLPLMDLKQSLKHDLAVAKEMRSRRCDVKDLKVHLFGNGEGAVATFLFRQRHPKGGRAYRWNSRVSFVFERNDGEWRIVHEHWSEATLAEEVMKKIRSVNALEERTSGRRDQPVALAQIKG